MQHTIVFSDYEGYECNYDSQIYGCPLRENSCGDSVSLIKKKSSCLFVPGLECAGGSGPALNELHVSIVAKSPMKTVWQNVKCISHLSERFDLEKKATEEKFCICVQL